MGTRCLTLIILNVMYELNFPVADSWPYKSSLISLLSIQTSNFSDVSSLDTIKVGLTKTFILGFKNSMFR